MSKPKRKLRRTGRRVAFDVHAIIQRIGNGWQWVYVGTEPEVNEIPLTAGQRIVPATLTVEEER